MKNQVDKDKVLLLLLPFWTPQIPPMGIACLKSHLQKNGYEVVCKDANTDDTLKSLYSRYFRVLKQSISPEKQGNFYNLGHEVLHNHMMAQVNQINEGEYISLVKELIYFNYYAEAADDVVLALNQIVNDMFSWLNAYIVEVLANICPDVLGLSVFKGNLASSLYCFKLAKEWNPNIKTVMGGAVFAQSLAVDTDNFNYFLRQTKGYIDKIIVGEGEELFVQLLRGELSEQQRVYTIEDIGNTTFDLSKAELPDLSDFNLSAYPYLAAYTSRSCPFQCNFCTETVYWGKYRKKEAKQITAELKELYDRYGYPLFLMCDSLLNPVVTELADEMSPLKCKIYWDGYLRVSEDTCNREKVNRWRQGGMYRARLGIESGSQHILDAMDKRITVELVRNSLETISNAGIKTTTYWVVGYPGETETDFQQTLDLLEELKDNIYEAECNPFSFYLSGQVHSEQWGKEIDVLPLYPEKYREMLMIQHWMLDCEPNREEVYKRVNRFVEHCRTLEIPNPYSLYDIAKADVRWKKLHSTAVPALLLLR